MIDLVTLTRVGRSGWKRPSTATRRTKIERGMASARERARALRHILTAEWTHDTEESAINECLVCGALAAVDATHSQPTELSGRALTRPCAGDPIWG
jgi:hypothetical protein